MTPPARSDAAAFELRRFEAAPVTGAIVVLELEGRFPQPTRFSRPPVLVIEPGADRRRIELPPVRTQNDGPRWHASYAVPAEALTAAARLALGIRGTLLELPAPDEPDDGERLTALAREANTLRRALETAEAAAATARAESAAITADRDAAVTAAREEAESAGAERVAALEHDVSEARRLAAADAELARTTLAEATARAADLETSLRAAESRATDAEARATDAESRATDAEQRAATAEELAMENEQRATGADSRAAEAEQRIVELEESLRVAEAAIEVAREEETAEVDAPLTTEMASVVDAEARAREAERELRVAREGIAVLRAELAEERERKGLWPESATTVAPPEDKTTVAPPRDARGGASRGRDSSDGDSGGEDETRVLRPAFGAEDEDPTVAFSATDEADATADRPQRPLERQGVPHPPVHRPGGVWIGRWVALAALVLFAIVLIALLFGL